MLLLPKVRLYRNAIHNVVPQYIFCIKIPEKERVNPLFVLKITNDAGMISLIHE